jgi:hypothetical protein
VFRSSHRALWIVQEWLRLAMAECKREAQVHPRNQNVWMCGVHVKVCAHERIYLHPRLVGHPHSRHWQHTMMGACWLGSHGNESKRCHSRLWRGQIGLEDISSRKSRIIYREVFGSPPLLRLGSYVENEAGFLPIVDAY